MPLLIPLGISQEFGNLSWKWIANCKFADTYIYTYLLCIFIKFYIQKINYFIPSPIHPNYIPTSGFISAHVKPSLWTVDGFVSQRGRSFCLTRTPPQVRKSIVRARSRCRPGGFFSAGNGDDSRSWRGVTMLMILAQYGSWVGNIIISILQVMHDNMMVSSIKTASQAIGISNKWLHTEPLDKYKPLEYP